MNGMNIRKITIISLFVLLGINSCYKNEPVPSADFTYAGNNEFNIPCTVMFTNQSNNAFSSEWRFGDDSTSTLKNPRHIYTTPGNYEVYLRAYTESRNEWASIIKTITIKDTVQ